LLKKYIGSGLSDFLNTEQGQAILQEALSQIVGEIVTTDQMNEAIELALQDVLRIEQN
jgi:hypothetical protein